MKKRPRMTRPITARPPTTPPTMAPVGVELEAGAGSGVGGTVVVVVLPEEVVEEEEEDREEEDVERPVVALTCATCRVAEPPHSIHVKPEMGAEP